MQILWHSDILDNLWSDLYEQIRHDIIIWKNIIIISRTNLCFCK